ncbi:MAG TPA: hypothetical protein PLM07_09105 [Candidatus Rifleibacterium sp.]|nr:hypothetical protein [Candidatus Rifleibacterium sp.]HPT46044.1 hypothetical protein [Candidatus Rifleibacterium sp.]
MADKPATRRTGCLRSLFIGIGCGCIYPVAMLVLLLVVGWFFLATPVDLMSTPPKMPEFAGPAQEDFWRLQEKRLDIENQASSTLILKPSEFNALLNAWQIPPVKGFCLQKARFVATDGGGTFYLIGSGFMMRSLVIRVEIARSADRFKAGSISINSWQAPEHGWCRDQVESWLMAIIESDRDSLPARFSRGETSMTSEAGEIKLQGRF